MSEFAPYAMRWLGSLQYDLSRYAIFAIAVWLIVWVLFARPLAGRKLRPERPPARQLVFEFLFSIRSVAVFSTMALSLFALDRAGLLPGPALGARLGPVWAGASLIFMILAHDAYFYWVHRLMHRPTWFRTFHRRHHRSNNPSPFTAYSFDLAEAAVHGAFVPLWMILVPTPWAVTTFFLLHQLFRNTLGHCGYELFPARKDGRPLFPFLTTTTHHDLHHAEARWNFGLYFTWWDRWMGTEHPAYLARFAQAAGKTRPAPVLAKAAAILLAAGLAAAPGQGQAQSVQRVAGDWATPGLSGVVRFEPCPGGSGKLCGRLVWVWDPASVRNNAVGSLILKDFVWKDGAWREGTVTDPADGRTYKGSIQLGEGTARLAGCTGPLCRTQVWRRLTTIPRPD